MKNNSTSPMTMPKNGNEQNMENSDISTAKLNTFEELYAAQDYIGAKDYLLNNNQAFEYGIWHYNLGTVELKLNQFAQARYHFELAHKSGFSSSALLNNLTFSKNALGVDDISQSTIRSEKIINFMTEIPSAAYISFSLILAILVIYFVKVGYVIKKSSIIILILLCLLPLGISKFYVSKLIEGVALTDIPMYEGPSKVFNEKGSLRAGSKVIIGDTKGNWLYVEYPLSVTGWIEKENFGFLK